MHEAESSREPHSVDVPSDQSSQLWGWQMQGSAPRGEVTPVLTAAVVEGRTNSGRVVVTLLGQACHVVWGIFPRSIASISFLQASQWFCGNLTSLLHSHFCLSPLAFPPRMLTLHRPKPAGANETWQEACTGQRQGNLLCYKWEPQEASSLSLLYMDA